MDANARIDRAALDALMNAARRQPRLDREEQLELARQHRHGDRRAGDALTLCNLGLVVRIARHMGSRLRGHELDLIQEGSEGLLRALRLFDPERGVAFTTYAAWWIRAYVLRYVLLNWRLVRIGGTRAQREAFFNLARTQRALESRGERADLAAVAKVLGAEEATLAALAQHIGLPEAREEAAMELSSPEEQQPDAVAAHNEQLRILHQVMSEMEKDLPARERAVVEARWHRDEPATLRACGEQLGITGERVRQIEQGLADQLRELAQRAIEPQLQTA